MSKTTGEPDTWYLTQSDINNHVENGTSGSGLLQATNPENIEDPGLIDSIDASEVTSYLADPTSIKGIGLRNKWKWNIIRKYGHNGLAYDPKTKKMYPGVEEAIAKLPTKYQHFVKFDMGSDLTAHTANAGKNAFADFAFRYGIPTMLTIAGLGPLATSIGSIGFLPTAINTAVGIGTGYGGSKIGEWGGQKLDRLFGTNYWTPMLSLAGGIGGGVLGGWGSNRALYRGINNSHINQTNFRNLFNKDYVDDALSFYHNRQLKDLAAWEQRMNKPFKYDATVNDIYPQLNTVDDALITYKGTELPESAFISTKNPLDDIVINRSNSQFQKDYNNAFKIKAVMDRRDLNTYNLGNKEQLKDFLIKQGVSEDLLTDEVLKKLIASRYTDYTAKTGQSHYTLRRTSNSDKNMYSYTMTRDGDNVGYINIYDERSIPVDPNISYNAKPGVGVQMVENTTIPDPFKPDRAVTNVKGVGEQGYNAVIGDLGEVRTGVNYQSPWVTTKTVAKYNTKNYLGDWGVHHYQGGARSGPVYDLLVPTYHEPVKYLDMFGLEGINNNGHFIIDFTKGPMYKHGGKIKMCSGESRLFKEKLMLI